MRSNGTVAPTTGREPAWALTALIALTLVAWSGACVRAGFSFDDAEAIFENPYVRGELPWREAFQRDYWHHRGAAGHWRPLALASLRADHALFGAWAPGYHATNVGLHVLVVVLAFGVARRLPGPLPLAGLALFALHPVLADAVAWISGRTSLWAACGGLVGCLGVLRARSHVGVALAATLGCVLAALGKEDGLAFALPVVLLAGHSGPGQRRSALRGRTLAAALGAGLAIVIVAALRRQALGDAWLAAPHAPFADEDVATRLALAGRAWWEGLRLAVVPLGYPPAFGATELARVPSGFAYGLGLAFWVAAGLGVLVAWWRPSRASAAFVAVVVALLPTSQIVPAGEVFAPRFLYLPLLFAIPLVDAALRRVPRPLVVALALAFVGLAWQRAGVYADRASFRRAVLAYAPDDAASWNDLGLAHEEDGRTDLARAAWEHATRVDPSYGRAWSNLGRLRLADGDLAAARAAFARAVELGPGNPIARVNLASAELRGDRPAEAARHYAHATELAPGLAPAWRGLANARLRQGDVAAARLAIERASALDPGDAATRKLAERIRARSR